MTMKDFRLDADPASASVRDFLPACQLLAACLGLCALMASAPVHAEAHGDGPSQGAQTEGEAEAENAVADEDGNANAQAAEEAEAEGEADSEEAADAGVEEEVDGAMESAQEPADEDGNANAQAAEEAEAEGEADSEEAADAGVEEEMDGAMEYADEPVEESVIVQEEPEEVAIEFSDIENEEAFEALSDLSDVEEVLVTSTKRETSLLTTPVAVSAFNQDALDRQKILDVTDIADLIPNLTIGESPSDSGVQIAVRGISSNNFTEIGDPTVGVHVDGIFTPRPQAALALLHDNERIEVNRGPQGTLFGRNSTAGSINIISGRPQFDEYAGRYELEVGSFQHYTFRGWTNFAISESYAVRVAFLYDVSGSYFDQFVDNFDFSWDDNEDGDFDDPYDIAPDGIPNTDLRRARQIDGKDAYGGTDRYGFRLNSLLSTSDRYQWLLSLDYFRDSSPGSFSVKDCEKAEGTFFACEGSQWDVFINHPGTLDYRLFTVRNEIIFDATDNLRVEVRAGNSRQFRDQYYDADGGARGDPGHPGYGLIRDASDFTNGDVARGFAARYGEDESVIHLIRGGPDGDNQYILDTLGFSGLTIGPWDDLALITRYSNYDSQVYELQFSSIANPDNPIEWIAGVFFMREDNEIRFDVESPSIGADRGALAESYVQPNRDVSSLATFGQIDVPLSDRFRMTFGTRWTLDGKSDQGGQSYKSYKYWTAGYSYTSPPGETVDYFAPPGEPVERVEYYSYSLVGVVENPRLLQSDDLTFNQGTYAADIHARIFDKNQNINANTFDEEWAQWTWKAGFDFTINDSLFWYGYIATGYKAGGFTDVVDLCASLCGSYPQLNAFPYNPERNLTYETGIKSQLFDSGRVGKLSLILTVFVSDVKDYQSTFFASNLTPPGTEFTIPREADDPLRSPDNLVRTVTVNASVGNLITRNIGESRSTGVEIEFNWVDLWPNGRFHGWITYLNAEVLDLPSFDGYYCFERAYLGLTPCPPSNPDIADSPDTPEDDSRVTNFKGNKLPFAPQWALTMHLEHNFKFGSSGIRFSPYFAAHWSDEYFFNVNNFDEPHFHNGQLPYWSFDLNLRLIDDKRNWVFEMYAQNLTDERVRLWGDGGPGFVRSSFAAPRNFGGKLVWSF